MKNMKLIFIVLIICLTGISYGQKKEKLHQELFALFPEVPQEMSDAQLKNVGGKEIPEKYFATIKVDKLEGTKYMPIGKYESGKYVILLMLEVNEEGSFNKGVHSMFSKTIEKGSGEIYMSAHYLLMVGENSRFKYKASFKRVGKDLIQFHNTTTEDGKSTESNRQYKFNKYLVFDKDL